MLYKVTYCRTITQCIRYEAITAQDVIPASCISCTGVTRIWVQLFHAHNTIKYGLSLIMITPQYTREKTYLLYAGPHAGQGKFNIRCK